MDREIRETGVIEAGEDRGKRKSVQIIVTCGHDKQCHSCDQQDTHLPWDLSEHTEAGCGAVFVKPKGILYLSEEMQTARVGQ